MHFDIITIFPNIFDSYLDESMIKRARARGICDIRVHDLRKFSKDKHKKVDDRPYGGGPGMVLKAEPIIKALESLLKPSNSKFPTGPSPRASPGVGRPRAIGQIPYRAEPSGYRPNSKQIRNSKFKTKIILFSASGKKFDAKMASEWAKKYNRIAMIAGHYEGVDERVKKVIENLKLSAFGGKIENLSIGPYVLTGGELPALVVIDAVSRHIPGFLGKGESLEEKRHGVGVPVYTRPEVFRWKGKSYSVPAILRSGDHKKIAEWRMKNKLQSRDVV